MLVGHLALGLTGKRLEPRVALGTWVIAALLADLIFFPLLLAGIEHVDVAAVYDGIIRRDYVVYADTNHWRVDFLLTRDNLGLLDEPPASGTHLITTSKKPPSRQEPPNTRTKQMERKSPFEESYFLANSAVPGGLAVSV